MMERSSVLIMTVLCMLGSSSSLVSALECYQCVNVEIQSGSLQALNGKSDPSCGTYPSGSNTATCRSGEVCGSVSGDMSAIGGFRAKMQVRGCVPSSRTYSLGNGMESVSGSTSGCYSTTSLPDGVMSQVFGSLATKLLDLKFSGTVCTCDFDYCSLCDGGIDIGGYCLKYWALALIGLGVLVAIVALVTCCCCCGCCGCCCCCRKGSPGVIHASPPYHTLTVIQTPEMAPPPHALSVQSGDIRRQPANQNVAVGGAYSGMVEDRERAGYNQKGDNFGASLA